MNIKRKVSSLREGVVIPLVIEDIAFGGDGVGRYENQAVFVPYTAPGDELAVKIKAVKKRHAHGIIHEITKPSPLRIAPRCSYFTRCGGCDYQHLSYPDQLTVKKAQVMEAFRRIGGFSDLPVADVIPSPRPFNYRGKADFWVRRRDGQRGEAGFLRRESRDIVDVERCEIIAESLNQALVGIHKQLEKSPGAVNRRQVTAWSWGGEIGADVPAALNDPVLEKTLCGQPLPSDLIHFPGAGGNFIDCLCLWPVHADAAGELAFCGDNIPRIVKGRTFLVPAYGFFQANLYLVGQLVDAVVAMCALTGRETVLDAYCGSGLFSMFLAPAARQVFGIELWEKAITCARENLARAGYDSAVFFSGDMGSILEREFIAPRRRLDVLVIDPPREGCKDLMFPSKDFKPKRIVYVSCHPATQARDCRFFADHGYTLQSVQPFDMFPQTSHIEVAALLLLEE